MSVLPGEQVRGKFVFLSEDACFKGEVINGEEERKKIFYKNAKKQGYFVPATVVTAEGLVSRKRSDIPAIPREFGITNFEASLQLVKTFIGTGILFLPQALSFVGATAGVILIFFTAYLTKVVIDMLVSAGRHLADKNGAENYGYSSTFYHALNSRSYLKRYSMFARVATSICLIVTAYSIIMIYTLIISNNLKDILYFFTGEDLSLRVCILLVLPLLVLANSTTKMKHLTPVTMVATISLFSGIAMTVYCMVAEILSKEYKANPPQVEQWRGVNQLPRFFSMVIFAFSAITSITAIENNMKHPESLRKGCMPLIFLIMLLIGGIYSVYGLLGYLAFGVNTKGPINENTNNPVWAIILKILISIGLYLSSPIQLYASLTMVGDYAASFAATANKSLVSLMARWSQLLIIVGIPLIVTDIISLVSLMGCTFILLQFIGPVVLNTIVFVADMHGFKFYFYSIRNFFIVLIGLSLAIIAFYFGVLDVIKSYS